MVAFLDKFRSWSEENHIVVKKIKKGLYKVPDWGTFILLYPKEEGLITNDFRFNITDTELYYTEEYNPDYFVFKFGERFFYAPVKKLVVEDEFGKETFYEVQLKDFLYLGNSSYENEVPFIPLGIHSEYELLNGSQQLELWCEKAKFYKFPAIGIADKNTLAGTLPLQVEAKKASIDFIIGESISVAHFYDEKLPNQEKFELKLYVKNETGWRNLLKISKSINVDYPEYIPEDVLLKHTEGLICVFSKYSVVNSIYYKTGEKAKIIRKFLKAFGKCYYQLDGTEYEDDQTDIEHLKANKDYLKNFRSVLSPVLISDAFYTHKINFPAKDALNHIGGVVTDYSEKQHLKTFDEVINEFGSLFSSEEYFLELIKDCLKSQGEIYNQCKDFEIETKWKKLPRYEFVPEGETKEEMFFRLIEDGLNRKVKEITPEYLERIERECKVIVGADLIDYFLIIWDIIHFAKDKNILVGTARGSIAGSLVAYCMDITSIDSIKHELIFERFLNETRAVGMIPDVDTDFPVAHRSTIKEYISKRFGEEHVCSIGSYTKLKLKAGLKDFGRVKGLQFGFVNYITNEIPHQLEYTFDDFVKFAVQGKELKDFFQEYSQVIYNIKDTLGQARSSSIHASAVVIVPKEDKDGNKMTIFDWLPIRKVDGMLVCEWEGKYVEKAGYLKEDILGLNQLDKFNNILKLIKKYKKKKIDLNKIPLDDKLTYSYFKKGWNEDVFQFTSAGLKNYSKLVRPDDIEDLTAMNALFRPGPMGSNAHLDFADMKHGRKEPSIDHPIENRFTSKTQGLYIYQETVMAAVIELAGFSLVESDTFRNAIKHFEKKTMLEYQSKFLEGCKNKNNIVGELADKLWDKILKFSGYGFNKAHSAAYSVMGYQCQWLKVHYPLEFWTSSLQFSDDKEIPHRISEIKKINEKISIRLPDVNKSGQYFTCDPSKNNIFWSLSKIKGIGNKVVNNIISNRKESGKFKSLEDFISRARVKGSGINKKVTYLLIVAGAFDILEKVRNPKERQYLLAKWADAYKSDIEQSFKINGSNSFWILKAKELTGLGDLDYKKMLKKQNEMELCNMYVEPDKFQSYKKEKFVCIAGELIELFERNYKKAGEKIDYGRAKILCNNEVYQIVLWNDTWLDYKDQLAQAKNKLIAISGYVRYSDYSNKNELQTCFHSKVVNLK